jgi:hypothetical protein
MTESRREQSDVPDQSPRMENRQISLHANETCLTFSFAPDAELTLSP